MLISFLLDSNPLVIASLDLLCESLAPRPTYDCKFLDKKAFLIEKRFVRTGRSLRIFSKDL